jgi:hypothetical protein
MRGLLSLWLLILCNLICAQQNNKSDIFVAYLVDRADLGLEYSSYKDSKEIGQSVASLMSGGQYIVSVVKTREGILVLHRTNTEAVEQHFAVVAAGELKSECCEQFDNGYAVTYYNKDGGFAIFDKDPTVTKQEIVGKLDQKSLKKFNDKGMYVVAGSDEAYVLQERHDGIVRQTIESLPACGADGQSEAFTQT